METLGSTCPDKSTNSLQVLFHEGVLCVGGRGIKYALWQTWIKGLHRKIIRVYFKPQISPASFFCLVFRQLRKINDHILLSVEAIKIAHKTDAVMGHVVVISISLC